MRCPQCQRRLKEGASVCRACGCVVDPALLDAPSNRTRSGFTQLPQGPASDDDEVFGFDVPVTDVTGKVPRAEDTDKTVMSPPPSDMSLEPASAAPAADVEELDDLLEASTLQAPAPAHVVDDADTVVRVSPRTHPHTPDGGADDDEAPELEGEKTVISPPPVHSDDNQRAPKRKQSISSQTRSREP